MKIFGFKMLFILFAIIVVILAILPVYIDPIAKKFVEQEVYPIFANRLKIGSVKVSLLRSMVEFENIELQQPEGFGEGKVLKIKSLKTWVSLLPLLNRHILLQDISITAPEVTIIKTRDNKFNTDYILPKEEKTENEKSEDSNIVDSSTPSAITPTSSEKSSNPFSLHLNKLSINAATITHYDYKIRPNQPVLTLSDLSLHVKDVNYPNKTNTKTIFSFKGTLISDKKNKSPFSCDGDGVVLTTPSHIKANNSIDSLQLADYVYFMPPSQITVESGNASVKSTINTKDDYLNSNHHVDVKNLRLSSAGSNLFGKTFFDLPAAGLMKFLDTTGGGLSFDFEVKGNMNSLKYRLREEFIKQITRSIVKTVGSVVSGSLTAPEKAKDLGFKALDSLKKMFK
jgi:hypothetical protein